ncbi:MAG TPA: hypothetical protein VNB29_05335 [Chthoniobacterales bacterium]|jgi:hypothetical protein|nr:hypothetical protein [Chthoniobacterales bacterium]
MKSLSAASLGAILLAVSFSEALARPTLVISRPAKGAVYHVGQMFTVAGHATPPSRISAIRVRVAGQRLAPIGAGSWRVQLSIGLPGRHRIVVASKIRNKVVRKVQRYVTIIP